MSPVASCWYGFEIVYISQRMTVISPVIRSASGRW